MTAVEPTVDLTVRGRRVLAGDGIVPATVAVRAGRIVAIEPDDRDLRAAERVELPDDEVLLPGSSTPTGTSTSRAGPSGKGSPPPPGPPRQAG